MSNHEVPLNTVEECVKALKHEDPVLRVAAAKALGDFKDPRAVEPLIVALNDENPQVRDGAAFALRMTKDPRAAEPLVQAFKLECSLSGCAAIGRALGTISVEALGKLLNENSIRGFYAAVILTSFGEPGVNLLIQALGTDTAVKRSDITMCILSTGDPAIGQLIKALGHANTDICRGAADILIEFGEQAVGQLTQALESEYPEVRDKAAGILSSIKERRDKPSQTPN